MKLLYKDFNWLGRMAKTIETKNLNKYGKSLAWVSMLPRLNECVIEVDMDGCVVIDEQKYREASKELLK